MSISVKKQLTVTNGAYTAKDVAGGLITFTNIKQLAGGRNLIVESVKLSGVVANPYSLVFLDADLATPAVADNGTFTTAAADGAKFLGTVPITAADYIAAASSFNLATVRSAGLLLCLNSSTTDDLYAYLVAEATTSPGTTRLDLMVDFIEV